MAAFQVFTYGRFWVFTEDELQKDCSASVPDCIPPQSKSRLTCKRLKPTSRLSGPANSKSQPRRRVGTNQQNIAANKQQVDANIKDIEENTKRFTALSEHHVRANQH
jgi:hypothetical protein